MVVLMTIYNIIYSIVRQVGSKSIPEIGRDDAFHLSELIVGVWPHEVYLRTQALMTEYRIGSKTTVESQE
jgi:hypothetical protein